MDLEAEAGERRAQKREGAAFLRGYRGAAHYFARKREGVGGNRHVAAL
jgi:hypothetical protein